MINGIVDIILNFVVGIVNIILTPIDLLIQNFLPNISNIIGYINGLINVILTYVGWVVDSLCIPQPVIIILTDFLIFKLTFPYAIWFIKLAIKWYNNLKL